MNLTKIKEDAMIRKPYMQKAATVIVALVCAVVVANAAKPKADDDDADKDDKNSACAGLPDHTALKAALDSAVATETSGLNLQMWATIVNRDGVVCAVAFSGVNRAAQWPGSRVISAQKANTANAFSLDGSSGSGGSGQAAGLALSTANL